jgi:hypothetical protein
MPEAEFTLESTEHEDIYGCPSARTQAPRRASAQAQKGAGRQAGREKRVQDPRTYQYQGCIYYVRRYIWMSGWTLLVDCYT